jgi:hypothetical protein
MNGESENMMVLDELQVDENGDIDLRIIPPDEVSLEPDILVTCAHGSRRYNWVRVHGLRPIARELGLTSGIAGLVHGGEDTYTIRTRDSQFVEVNRQTHPAVVRVIEELAETVGKLALLEANNGGLPRAQVVEPKRGGAVAPSRTGRRRNRLSGGH